MLTFDAHSYVKTLGANGFTEQQAEILSEQTVGIIESNVATKRDIPKRIKKLRKRMPLPVRILRLCARI